jgi:hypothetical protein
VPLPYDITSIHLPIARHTLTRPHNHNIMRSSLVSALVVTLAAQATANSWFGKSGTYRKISSCMEHLRRRVPAVGVL